MGHLERGMSGVVEEMGQRVRKMLKKKSREKRAKKIFFLADDDDVDI